MNDDTQDATTTTGPGPAHSRDELLPPIDDGPHTPTEAEAADLGRPPNAEGTTTSAEGAGHTFVGTLGGSIDVAGAVAFSTSSGRPEPPRTPEQVAAQQAAQERDDRKWHWLTAIERKEYSGLHPNVVEALKRLELAEADWTKAKTNIAGQYLKSLEHSTPDHAAQADAVRELMEPR